MTCVCLTVRQAIMTCVFDSTSSDNDLCVFDSTSSDNDLCVFDSTSSDNDLCVFDSTSSDNDLCVFDSTSSDNDLCVFDSTSSDNDLCVWQYVKRDTIPETIQYGRLLKELQREIKHLMVSWHSDWTTATKAALTATTHWYYLFNISKHLASNVLKYTYASSLQNFRDASALLYSPFCTPHFRTKMCPRARIHESVIRRYDRS